MIWIGIGIWLAVGFLASILIGRLIAFGGRSDDSVDWSEFGELGPEAHDQTIVP